MLNRIFILISLVVIGSGSLAQTTDTTQVLDSVELRYGKNLIDTLPELADSIFKVLKTKKFEKLIPYIATSDMLKEEFDSMDLERLQKLSEIKYQYMVNNLRKQHFRMVKEAKVMRYSLRNMELVKMRIRTQEHEIGSRYGEITYLCKSGKHKFYITFLAIEIVGKWFIGDELRVTSV